ncbi:hypothetical protein O181_078045 [Austropuccinia psidii MF-1]|uniref:TAFII55 protein conserved region domain-containing protein n=1 Tax=Austropuccinia psidii MF-1 TaxID=1389203 RepID=A0A9Q3IGK3_9BASI|nr:hypothetical protein [Austropuccinia psidii MF-1]
MMNEQKKKSLKIFSGQSLCNDTQYMPQPSPSLANPISQPTTKLKLKIAAQQDKNQHSNGLAPYLQEYNRELDSDPDEPMAFEEQFILKMPPGPECEKLRALVEQRKNIDSNEEKVFFKFKDSRRGIFNIGNKMFGMKLVDLPCVIESQKTFDNKHLFKIADICQMLLVDDTPISDESTISQGNFNIEDFIYPHGLTPPLHHVRKRRFRKRLNKRTIETVERAVERLLEEDSRADQVIIDIVDNVRDLSDSEGEDYQPPQSATIGPGNLPPSKIVYNKPRPSIGFSKRSSSQPPDLLSSQLEDRAKEHKAHGQDDPESLQAVTAETPVADSLGAPTPAADDFDESGVGAYNDDDEGSIDNDLAAEIEAGLMEGAAAEERAAAGLAGPDDDGDEDSEDLFGNGEDDEEEEDDDDEDDEDDDDDDEDESNETVEDKQRVRLLQGEIKDLESAISRKKSEIAKAANVILRKRFEEALRKLSNELESKKTQLNSTQLSLQNAVQERKNRQARQAQERAEEAANKSRPLGEEGENNIASLESGKVQLEIIEEDIESQSRAISEADDFEARQVSVEIPIDPSMDIDE